MKRITDIQASVATISKAHTDLSALCAVVCRNDGQSLNVCTELTRIRLAISSASQTLNLYQEDMALAAAYEECDLAEGFLTCVILTVWHDTNPPTPEPLAWREAMVIYGMVFAAMHRLGLAIKTCQLVTA